MLWGRKLEQLLGAGALARGLAAECWRNQVRCAFGGEVRGSGPATTQHLHG